MRPRPLPEDVRARVTPYYETAAWIEATHRNGFPYAHDAFFNNVLPAPRFYPTVNPIGRTTIAPLADRLRDDNAYSALAMGGWNVSGLPIKTLPSKIR